jgi:hypothetical protein
MDNTNAFIFMRISIETRIKNALNRPHFHRIIDLLIQSIEPFGA